MDRIGIRDLKERTSEILRKVREDGATFEVTYHGRPIAHVVPVKQEPQSLTLDEWLAQVDQLSKEIGRLWPEGVSAADAIREDRERL